MDASKHGTKFGLLAIRNGSTSVVGDVDVLQQGEIAAHATCPIALPEHWQQWLGTLQTADLVEANLTIAVQVPSATPDVLDGESRTIEQRLDRIWHGLRVHGIPDYQTALIALGGINLEGEISVRRVSRFTKSYRHPCGIALTIDAQTARGAVNVGYAIQGISTGNANYRRLRAGYSALVAGMEETWGEERLHQFVRALDGLMAIPMGGGRNAFAQRGQTFMTAADIQNLLVEMYVLRNTQEHLNDFRTVVNAPNENQFRRRISARSYQAEQAAIDAYRRIFTNPALQAQFITEASISAFWGLANAARGALWGLPFDLDLAEADHNLRFH